MCSLKTHNTKTHKHVHINRIERERERETLRSMLEREERKGLNSGSLWMSFHLPVPCLATPARRASSSSDVHFCFGFPISLCLFLVPLARFQSLQIVKYTVSSVLPLISASFWFWFWFRFQGCCCCLFLSCHFPTTLNPYETAGFLIP